MPRIFDCFPFFNELDLLEVRLAALDPVVDFFVLSEMPITHRGQPKPLHFRENRQRFEKYLPKIRHVVADDVTQEQGFDANWVREIHQRTVLERALGDARDDDVVMMSDLDEVPRADKVVEAASRGGGLRIFKMRFFAYFANCEPHPGKWWWLGTGMSEYRLAKGRFADVLRKVPTRLRTVPEPSLRKRISVQMKARISYPLRGIRVRFVEEGGHHFSWLGGADAVLSKRAALVIHRGEVFSDDYLTSKGADDAVRQAMGTARPLDETMPAVLREPRFSHLLAPHAP